MSQPKVDREAKVIYGYTVMSAGEARGHGFFVDDITLDQLVELGNKAAANGKTRIRHPDGTGDGFGRFLGYSKNFRREPDRTVADLYLSDLAFKSPEGDLGTYVMDAAELAADTFGASPEADYVKERRPGGLPAMRLKTLRAIAIVDDPATNRGFFCCLSAKDEDVDIATLESQIATLTKERDTLQTELSSTKANFLKAETDQKTALETHTAALSAARTEAAAKAIADERARAADILALCGKAEQANLSAKFISEGISTGDVQTQLFAALCAKNKPVGDGDGDKQGDKKDPNAKYKTEYAALSAAYAKAGVTEASYINSRRIDDGLEVLGVKTS